MPAKQVAVRLGVDGSTEFKRDFADASTSAQGSLNQIGAAANANADQVERAVQRQQAALQRYEQELQRASRTAYTPQAQAAQAQINASLGIGAASGSAKTSAAAFREAFQHMEQMEARAASLRAKIDPLGVAQKTFAAATQDADAMLAKGVISATEHAAALKLAKGELDEAEKAAKRLAGGAGLTTLQLNVMTGAIHHSVDALLSGANPMRVLTVETAKAAPEMGGLGNLARIAGGFIFSAGGAAVAAAAMFAIGAKAAIDYEDAYNRLANAATGFGARWNTTADALEQAAESGAKAAHISVASARDMEAGFLHAGTIGASVFEDLVGGARKFALATGQDVKHAGEQLTKDFADPAEGARKLNAELGFLTDAELRRIEVLAQENDKTEAQKALAQDLNDHLAHTEQHVSYINNLLQQGGTLWSNFWAAAGKGIDKTFTPQDQKTPQEQLDELLGQRGLYDSGVFGPQNKAAYDAKIVELQRQVAEQRRQGAAARSNQDASAAGDQAWKDTGYAERDALQTRLNRLRAGADAVTGGKSSMAPERWTALQQDISRTTEALKSWLPPAEKKLQIEQIDAQMARVRDPAERGRLATQKAMIETSGQLLTVEERRRQAQYAGQEAQGRADRRFDRRAETIGRELAAMRANAAAALDVAAAYQQSASAGEVAEARRKALTDATKKGADVEAFAAAQLQADVGEAAASGAKTLAQMRDETAARRALNEQVQAGELDASDIAERLKAEAATRQAVAAAAHAEGRAKQQLLAIVDGLNKAQADATAEANRSAVLTANDKASDQIDLLRKELSLVGATNRERAVQIAREKALLDLRGKHIDPNSDAGRAYVAGEVGKANAGADVASGTFAADTLKNQADQLAVLKAEAAAVGKSEEARRRIVDELRLELELKRQGVDLTSKDGQQILKNAQEIEKETEAYRRQQAQVDELKSTADNMVDTLGNALQPDHWRRWGDVGKEILADLEKEFIKLALLNPLKNMINGGGNLPTLGNMFGGGSGGGGFNFASLFSQGGGGGSDAMASAGNAFMAAISNGMPGFAGGTDDAPGGWAMVGENGPEPMYVPRGAKILNHASAEAAFRDALNGGGRGGGAPLVLDMRGAITTPELMSQVNQIAALHAARATHTAIKTARRSAPTWQARASQEKG